MDDNSGMFLSKGKAVQRSLDQSVALPFRAQHVSTHESMDTIGKSTVDQFEANAVGYATAKIQTVRVPQSNQKRGIGGPRYGLEDFRFKTSARTIVSATSFIGRRC
jgi:hypothetical protein